MSIGSVGSSPAPVQQAPIRRDSDGDNDGDKGPKTAVDNDSKAPPPPSAATGAGQKLNVYA